VYKAVSQQFPIPQLGQARVSSCVLAALIIFSSGAIKELYTHIMTPTPQEPCEMVAVIPNSADSDPSLITTALAKNESKKHRLLLPSLPVVKDWPTEIDERDKNTADDWVPRHKGLIRLTGKHPFNAEPNPKTLVDAGFVTPVPLHYVR